MEVEFLSQMRYNLFVSPEQWEDWKLTVSRMYTYHRDVLRQRAIPRKVFHPSIPPSPPVSTIPTSPSFTEQPNSYMPGSPFRMHFAPYTQQDRMSSPHRVLPPMDDSPSAASAAIHARVTSRKRSREENSLSVGLQPPPSKRYQPQYPPSTGALGIQMPPQHAPPPSQRLHYPTDNLQHPLQQSYPPQSSSTKQSRVGLSLSLADQSHSPISYHHPQPTSPYAVSPLSPYSTNSNFNSLSPYAVPSQHHQRQTPQPLEAVPVGYASGFSSPYKYLQNRFSPYAPVRPARTLPSQFVPPRMQWSILPSSTEELYYQPLGSHGHGAWRRGVPAYPEFNPGYYPPPPPPSSHHHGHQQGH